METTIQDAKSNGFIDVNCKLDFQGKYFESGGAFLAVNKKTGKLGGILYANPRMNVVTNWHGDIKIPAKFGQVFNSNFHGYSGYNRRQYCWFTYQGHNFIGINYSVDNQDCISVREVK